MNRTLPFVTLAFLSLVAVGCASDPGARPAASAANTDGSGTDSAATRGHDRGDGQADVRVDNRLAALCDLPTPRFAFDRADIGLPAKNTLGAIVSCFKTGPAKGKDMRIVGHADPRGETHYNFALGQRRAGNVAAYLTQAGIEGRRVATSSRGELEALGTDEAGWARDRRVEIFLAD